MFAVAQARLGLHRLGEHMRPNISRLAALVVAFSINSAAAQGQLNIICSVQLPWCEAVVTQFQKDTGIKIGMTQKSAGEAMAQVAAERANPKVDIWYTGSGGPPFEGGGPGPHGGNRV